MRNPRARDVAAVLVVLGVGFAATACTNADLPEPSGDAATSGGPWATQANTACTEIAGSSTRPSGDAGSGVSLLAWHQDVAYLMASRLSAVPEGGADAKAFVTALQGVGTTTEALVTALEANPVDPKAREEADAARTAAIGKAASLSAQLGLAACTPLVAGG